MDKQSRCKTEVVADAMGFHTKRCSRNAVKDGYCFQHHPAVIAQRRLASERRWAERREKDPIVLYANLVKAIDALIYKYRLSKRKNQWMEELIKIRETGGKGK